MKKLIYILIMIFSLNSVAHSKTDTGDKILLGALGLAVGTGIMLMMKSEFKEYKTNNPLGTLKDFLEKNQKWKTQVEDEIRYRMSKTKNEGHYINYQKVADKIGMSDVPPFQPEDTSGFVSDGFKEHTDRYGNKLENPINNIHYPWILENPQTKEKVDTRLEFPLESPEDWKQYLILQSNSYELGKNMESAGKPRPNHSVAHHIVPATMKKSADAVKILDDYGIKVNDAENGVWLPQKGLDSKGNPSGAIGIVHSGVHPNVYAIWVNDLIKNTPVNPNNKVQSKQNLEQTLESIRQKLINAQNNGKTWYDIMK